MTNQTCTTTIYASPFHTMRCRVGACACVGVCVRVWVHVRVWRECARTCVSVVHGVCAYVRMRTYVRMCACLCIYAYVCKCVCSSVCVHVHILLFTCMCVLKVYLHCVYYSFSFRPCMNDTSLYIA